MCAKNGYLLVKVGSSFKRAINTTNMNGYKCREIATKHAFVKINTFLDKTLTEIFAIKMEFGLETETLNFHPKF